MSPTAIPGNLILRNTYVVPQLLDYYPGAAAAYSLRNLTGNNISVVRVRRDNDNAEADFTATQVSDGSLAAWVGAGNNGFVRTWYDQSGNGNDATQVTAASQPKIVSSGTLVIENGNAALNFDGADDYLDFYGSFVNSTFGPANGKTAICVSKDAGITGQRNRTIFIGASTLTKFSFICQTSALFDFSFNGYAQRVSIAFNVQQQFLAFAYQVNTQQTAYLNSTATGTNNFGGTWNNADTAEISNANQNQYHNGTIQEIILYPSDQSANRTAIEANINAHYSIYP